MDLTLNDALAGLVGITADILLVFGVEFIDKVLKIDDPVGAVSVHGLNGLRVSKRIEEEGLDIYEHGESAYN